MNIFYNRDENRIRAGWRLAAQFFLMTLLGVMLFLLFGEIAGVSSSIYAMAAGALISIILAARGLDKRSWGDYGLQINKKWMIHCALGFALAGAVVMFIFLVEFWAGWATFTGFGWQRLNAGSYVWSLSAYFLFMVVVGCYEELLFRGYQIVNLSEGLNMPALNRTQAVILAFSVSSLVFGFAHLFNPNATWIATLNVAFAGAMLAFPFIITGNLSISIGLHIGWNFFQGGVFGFSVSGIPGRASLLQIQQTGPEFLTGGAFGPEGGLVGLIGMGVIVLSLTWFFHKSDQALAIYPALARYEPSSRNYPV